MRTAQLGIIGGGSIGVSFLAQLISHLEQIGAPTGTVQILLFEPSETIGPGDVYANDLNTNLLNIPARNMTAFAEDKSHFCQWLRELSPSYLATFNVTEWDEDSFLPRPLFGRYLEWVFTQALARAKSLGVTFTHICQRANRLERLDSENRWMITTEKDCWGVDFVVLCNGNLPSVSFPDLIETPRFFNNSYPVKRVVEAIGTRDTVAVLGTSLSAVDAIVALKEAGHRGTILAVSRNGRLPSVRSVKNRHSPTTRLTETRLRKLAAQSGGKLTLSVVADMMITQLQEMGQYPDLADILGSNLPAENELSREITASMTKERLWQVVASASNDVIDVVWHLLDDDDRLLFLQRWRSLWMARRAMFPMENALKLQGYFESYQLEVLPGFTECRYNQSQDKYVISLQTATDRDTISVRHVINATSFSLDPSRSDDSFTRHLLDSGIALPDSRGGLQLDYETGCLLNDKGETQTTLSLLGSLAVGTYFWTLSMDVNARLALQQARRIAKALKTSKTATEDCAMLSNIAFLH